MALFKSFFISDKSLLLLFGSVDVGANVDCGDSVNTKKKNNKNKNQAWK